jgi:hypothetical protein
MFAARLWHRRCEFGIRQANQDDSNSANTERKHGAEAAGLVNPVSRKRDPAPANHGTEGKRQDLPESNHPNKLAARHL